MPLNSYQFMTVFLPIAFVGYWLCRHYRSPQSVLRWLVSVSVLFYAAAGLAGVALIGISISWDYLAARVFLAISPERVVKRKLVIYAAISLDIAFLCYFKYLNFFLEAISSVSSLQLTAMPTYLPLGISFLTFQKIGFLADLRSGQIKQVRPLEFALFGLFFPKAIAGPIIRYKDFVTQLQRLHAQAETQYADIAVGVCLVAFGIFKEAVIASIAGQFVPSVFEPNLQYEKVTLITGWIGALAYTLQLYFDFSGYSDMALGVARIFGIRLPMNFNSPLKARSLVDFWARWHITLTRFLTWQIYIPLVRILTRVRMKAGKAVLRGSDSKMSALTILIGVPTVSTMTLSGLWHGAGWHYILWGTLHGVCLSVNQSWKLVRSRIIQHENSFSGLRSALGRIMTLTVVICALVLFRAENIRSALNILAGMFGANGVLPHYIQLSMVTAGDTSWAYETILGYWYPCACLGGILSLAMMAPNSLQLLRGYQPALDFPPVGIDSPGDSPEDTDMPRGRGAEYNRDIRQLLLDMRTGLPSSRLSAILYAMALILGLSAIFRSGAFIYGQF